MKTAMQFLKEEIESKVFPPTYNDGKLTDYQYGHNIAYSVVLTLAEYLIEVEKEQIIVARNSKEIEAIEAWDFATDIMSKGVSNKPNNLGRSAEDYYNQTYNQNK
jgi:hypothetical protein